MSLSHFDEKSGIVSSPTDWGRWSQTVNEVNIEISCDDGITSKETKIMMKPNLLKCTLKGKLLFEVFISDRNY